MKFHHVGIACVDLERSLQQFRALHSVYEDVTDVIYDPEQDAHLKLVHLGRGVYFEFVSGPTVEAFVKRNVDIYHTCFETDSFDEQVKMFMEQKALPLGPAKPAILFDMRRVIFLKTNYGIVELLEV